MANSFESLEQARAALIEAVEAVTNNNEDRGANDQWLNSLSVQANGDEKATKKVTTLQFFDQILGSSINEAPDMDVDLGQLVTEIRGYQDLTERFFSDLRKLTVKDWNLEQAAIKKRNELFEVLNQVQKWLLERQGGVSPEEFDACTNQFLSLMKPGSNELSLTQQLFKNQYLEELAESDPENLTNAWGDVVSIFVEDAQDTDEEDPLKIGHPETIASYLCIHDRLETLYGLLGTNISLVN